MDKIKKKDFVEIEYTGKSKVDDLIFDTTDQKTAKENNIFDQNHKYGPIKVMIGGNQVIPGLDRFMEGKEPGTFNVNLEAVEGFGRKNPKLLRLMPKSVFTKQKINPMPGLPINIDGMNGLIKTVSGGRCMVDFNHPLSGKDLFYNLKINRLITDEKEKVESIIELQLNKKDFNLDVKDDNITINTKVGLKTPLKNLIENMVKKFTNFKKVEFKEEKTPVLSQEKKEDNKEVSAENSN